MNRLTEKNYKASDGYCMKCSEGCGAITIAGFCEGDCDRLREIVDRMGQIEDILGDTYDLDRLRELVEADKAGHVKIIPEYVGKACGTCGHFHRVTGTRHGTCDVKPYAKSRYGTPYPGPFEPSQSRIACKQYEAAEAALAKEGRS